MIFGALIGVHVADAFLNSHGVASDAISKQGNECSSCVAPLWVLI